VKKIDELSGFDQQDAEKPPSVIGKSGSRGKSRLRLRLSEEDSGRYEFFAPTSA
jgi:hypothetical protein